MKRMKRKILLLVISLTMIIPVTLASIFAEGEAFNYNLNYVLSEDKTYATVTLELLSTEDIQYTSITDINGEVERLEPINEVTREYEVSENKEYTLLIGYTYQTGEKQSQELKITVSDIELPVISSQSDGPITEGAYTINSNGIITNIDKEKLDNRENIVIPDTVGGISVNGIEGYYNYQDENNKNVFGEKSTSDVKTIQLPEGLTSIGRGSFYNCESLEDINLPKGMTNIDTAAFSECKSLKRMEIPNQITNLTFLAFDGCEGLTSIRFPEKLSTIESIVFRNCKNLKNIECPLYSSDFLKDLSNNPFAADSFVFCTGLEKIIFIDKVEDVSRMDTIFKKIKGNSNAKNVIKCWNQISLSVNQSQIINYGAKEFDLDDLIINNSVFYKYADDGSKTVSTDFSIPVDYSITKRTRNDSETRLDLANKKLYIGENEDGIITLTGKLFDETASVDIETTPLVVNSMAIQTNPTQLEYRDGDTFNPNGLQITVTYNSGEVKTINYQDEKENFSFDLTTLKTGDKAVKVTYQGKEATINIEMRQPVLADASKNVIEGIKESYTKGETVSFEVKGDYPDNNNPVRGDTRYIPLNWKTTEIKEFENEGKASFSTSSMIAGKQTLIVTFQLEEYDGNQWIVKGTDNKSVDFELKDKVEIIVPNNPPLDDINKPLDTESNKPKEDKDISLDSTTDANGNVVKVDKYGNIIKTEDNSYILLYAGVMVISGMAGYRVYKKRKVLK